MTAAPSPVRRGACVLDLECASTGTRDRIHDFEYRVTSAVAAIGHERFAASAQMVERGQVRGGQIVYMDEIADATAVGRWIVIAEQFNLLTQSHGVFARYFDQLRGVGRVLADTAMGVAAGDVEVAQAHMTQIARVRQIGQHPFADEFGASIGIDRQGRRGFVR